ncbi:MAG TPA: helix-turn-helix transcriptional regulator [Candidatus Dormibacteraeota bacterium]|nr:helix-turn-helix transcriptional regulator [Candidatus Dormibacteraeota bacterium]
MNLTALGLELARNRRRARLTQREVGERMGSTQSSIARLESGAARPSLDFLDRFARATGIPISIEFGKPSSSKLSVRERRKRVRSVLGEVVFDPWLRNPSNLEKRALNARGLTREHFQRKRRT